MRITLETATLLKQKDIRVEEDNIYTKDGELTTIGKYYKSIKADKKKELLDKFCLLAPTQSKLQKVLREEHETDVLVRVEREDFMRLYGYRVCNNLGKVSTSTYSFATYEQALEEGLYQALIMKGMGITTRTIDNAVQMLFKSGKITVPLSKELKDFHQAHWVIDVSCLETNNDMIKDAIQTDLFNKIQDRLQLEHEEQFIVENKTITLK